MCSDLTQVGHNIGIYYILLEMKLNVIAALEEFTAKVSSFHQMFASASKNLRFEDKYSRRHTPVTTP